MSSPVCCARGATPATAGWGDFTGPPPSSEMAIRASSTAISAAKPNDANRGPLPCKRDSHSCVRESSMVLGMFTVTGNHTGYSLGRSSICFLK